MSRDRLIGEALLKKVVQLEGSSKRDKAIACGYVSDHGGTERVAYSAFYEALATASGVPIEEPKNRKAVELRFKAKVLKNGSVLIGPRYVEMINAAEGSYLQISHKGNALTLTPATESA